LARTHTGKAGTLSGNELNTLLKIVEAGNNGLRNKTILLLTHYLALRAKEISCIKITDVLDGKSKVKSVLRLQANYTKGNKHRDIPLSSPKVIKAIQAWIEYRKEHDGLVFNVKAPLFKSQKGPAFSPNSMSRMISKLYKDAHLEGCSSHTGRRSMITKLANNGIDLNSIRVLAGHSNIATTQRYIQTDPDMLAKIMKGL
jgi:integrase/recombinase XerD